MNNIFQKKKLHKILQHYPCIARATYQFPKIVDIKLKFLGFLNEDKQPNKEVTIISICLFCLKNPTYWSMSLCIKEGQVALKPLQKLSPHPTIWNNQISLWFQCFTIVVLVSTDFPITISIKFLQKTSLFSTLYFHGSPKKVQTDVENRCE